MTISRVLVTGAAGRIGRAVLARLAEQGVAAHALVLDDPGDLAADRVFTGSAADPARVRTALDGVDGVIHLAAIPTPERNEALEVFTANVSATFAVLEEAGRAGIRRAVIASSYAATGLPFARTLLHPAYVPIDPAMPTEIEDPYALSKQTDELTAAMMAHRHGMTVVALRYPFVGGFDERLPGWAAKIAERPELGARDLWSYLETGDAARAAHLALGAPVSGAPVFYVAAPRTVVPYSTAELLDRFHPGVPRRADLPGRTVPIDLRPAREVLGFTAAYELDLGD
ncbi:nucleoside-diphosphate-sugar epimerase [Hamadaea flava]|uniref:NAD-dependent epimerase/dehydratase family protein n=1 Tax=Hamadaea flava TaxID=1742688 RepID=A0ABV8LPL9_9ACTN|nr:NAD(P)-dependent oxidoreductase [Hamadaea flava]MCP2323003.1 nucleoside-diphosphate-sugar epimerase [Hamadaea flava]